MSEWGKMTVAQLKAELTERGLEKTGTKADLVSRLAKHDAEAIETTTNGEVEAEADNEPEEEVEEATPAEEPATEEEAMEVAEQEDVLEHQEEEEADQAEEEEQPEAETEEFVIKEEVGTDDITKDDSKLDESVEENKDDVEEKMELDEKASKDADGEKSDKKGKKGPKKWVAIMENEKTSKVLDELSKINKLDCLKGRAKELFLAHEFHKVRIFPLLPDDISDPLIVEVIKKSVSSMMKFTSSDPEVDPKGMLEVTFSRRSVLDEYIPKLALFKESLNVIVDKKEHEWKDLYRQATYVPENASDLEKLRLFAPSLPQSVQEADMWDYFPKARELLLIDAKPRKHAYITFCSEESMIKSVEELNNRGPQKDDFKFCRLLRLADVVKLIPRRGDRGPRTPRRGADGPRGALRTPRAGPRTPRLGPRPPRPAGPSASDDKKPQRSNSSGKSTPRQPPSGGQRSRDIQGRRNAISRRRDDRGDRRSSYWGAAPRQRGAGLQSSFSQLQQPSPLVHPQAQQGLQVLDTLLSTLGQMGNLQQSGNMARQTDRRGHEQRSRNDGGAQKRARSPFTGRNKRRRRGPQGSPRQTYGDSRRDSYGQSSSYGGDMGNSSMGYSRADDNRQSSQGGDRMYNTLDAVNKIARLRETLAHSGQRQEYGMGGSGYRQDSYY